MINKSKIRRLSDQVKDIQSKVHAIDLNDLDQVIESLLEKANSQKSVLYPATDVELHLQKQLAESQATILINVKQVVEESKKHAQIARKLYRHRLAAPNLHNAFE